MNENKIHLHVENSSALGRVFEADAARVNDALARHPGLASRVAVTIGYDGDILAAQLATAGALFCWDFPRHDLAARAPRLRFVHAHAAGINHLLPLDWLPQGVALINSRGVHGRRATEYASMAILMLNNRVPEMVTNQSRRRWQQCFNSSVDGKTLLIIGVGNIGGGVARWAKGMDMYVIGVRRSARAHRYVDEMHVPGDLHMLLPRADFVLMSAPYTEHGGELLGEKELDLFKPGAGLVNYSRAACVDYAALARKLERDEMSAILDVFAQEPLPPDSTLWDTPNLVITPHCSSDDSDYYTPRTLDLLCTNLERLLAGKSLRNRVSRNRQY